MKRQPWDLGYDYSGGFEGPDRSLLATCLNFIHARGDDDDGSIALEFGVGSGETTRMIAGWMPVIGFDSFQGLPEDWRPGFPAGRFAEYEEPRDIAGATIVPGWFDDTVPGYDWSGFKISLVHIDCDLYSSTKTVLDSIGPWLREGCIIVFDEYFGYDDDIAGGDALRTGEARAWQEFAEAHDVSWRVLGHGREQWAIQLTEVWIS